MSAPKQVGLIAAVAANGVIGADNSMPWQLPEDLRHFARTTMGQVVIMGRKTYESIGAPLKGRSVIVLSRESDLEVTGCQVCHTVKDALAAGQQLEGEQIWIAGGEQVYAQTIDLADVLLITHLQEEYEGDSFFPAIDPIRWRSAKVEYVQGEPAFTICRYLPTSLS